MASTISVRQSVEEEGYRRPKALCKTSHRYMKTENTFKQAYNSKNTCRIFFKPITLLNRVTVVLALVDVFAVLQLGTWMMACDDFLFMDCVK
jgi:hypothetical protein